LYVLNGNTKLTSGINGIKYEIANHV